MRANALKRLACTVAVVTLSVGCGDDADSGGGTPDGTGGSGSGGTMDAAAGGDGDGDGDGDDTITVSFDARIGAETFGCDTVYSDLGTSGAAVEPIDFRLFVHDVRLLVGDQETPLQLAENDWQHGGVALLDFEDASGTCKNGTPQTHSVVTGTAPGAAYDGIAFRVGVPAELNHADPAAAQSPLNLTALHWNWNGGYKFMRIDMRVFPDDDDAGIEDGGMPMGMPYNFHLGSTMCTGDAPTGDAVSCGHPNRPTVKLTGFDHASDVVVIDYAALVADDDMLVDQGGKPGCMSFPGDMDCPAIFSALGLDYASGDIDDGQRVFYAEQR